MGFLARLTSPSGLRATHGAGTPAPWSGFWYTPEGFLTGDRLSCERALTLSAFWKGTRILSENIASFTAKVHERLDRGHRVLPRHPLTWTIGHQPNPDLDAFAYWETTMVHLVHRGNGFSFKRYVPSARGARLYLDLIHPDRVRVTRRPSGALDYQVRDTNGQLQSFGREDIFHVRGMSLDGRTGVSVIEYAAASLGGALAAENYAHRFFKQGAMAGVAAIPEHDIGEAGMKNLLASVQSYLTGLENAHGVFVPPDKISLQTLGYDAEKAQILLTRQFTVEQVAHWLNLPPGMLGDSKTPTFASSQQFRQDLVDLCFRPWVERLESRIDIDILQFADEDDPLRYFAKFEMDALLRGNAKERAEIHERGIRSGYKTRNEARLDEDLQPIDGLDDPIVALNIGSVEHHASGHSPEDDRREARALRIATREAERLVRKEIAAATKAAIRFAQDGPGWQTWLREFYEDHGREVAERLCMPLPVAREYASRQGLRLAERGVQVVETWERTVVAELAELALSPRLDAAAAASEERAA